MKNLIVRIAWGISLMAVLVGCNAGKRISYKAVTSTAKLQVKTDTFRTVDSSMIRVNDSSSHELVVKDTTIGIAGSSVGYDLDDSDMADTTLKAGNVSLHIYNDGKGGKRVECKTDSFTLVVANLKEENTYLRQNLDALLSVSSFADHSEIKDSTYSSSTLKETVQKENAGFWGAIWNGIKDVLWYIICFVAGGVCVFILHFFKLI